ncbi:MAG: type II secretion system F family protein [Bacillota bacterium]
MLRGIAFLSRIAAALGDPVILYPRPGMQELMNFCQQFAAMLSAGISVLTGLEILQRQAGNPRLKKGIRSVAQHVEQGKSLAEALAREKEIFNPFFTSMVEAGETGGVLERTMQLLAVYFEKKKDLEQKLKTATAYPKFVFLIILGLIIFLLTFVLPAFAGIFAGMGIELPLPTRVLLSAGEGLRVYWHFLFTGGAVVYLVICRLLKTDRGIYYRDFITLRIPLFGPLYRKVMVARFCRTLSTMLGSGLGLLTALEQAKNVVNNRVFAERIDSVRESVVRGESVAATLAAANFFPLLVIGMASVGEQSGRLEEMLARAADLFESEVNYIVERLGSLLEPALVIFLSLVVGGMVLSVFLPLFGVFELYL